MRGVEPDPAPVWLVGTASDDPDLLTVRAHALLTTAAVVIADPEVLGLAHLRAAPVATVRPTVAGEAPATWPSGVAVVRLYAGEVVAASADDRAALRAAGREVELVPGVDADAVAASVQDAVATGRRPLSGRRIVVTRPLAQAEALAAPLRRLGAEVVCCPTIRIDPPDDGGAALDAAFDELDRYAWLVVTSANGASAVLDRLSDARRLAGVGVAAIGPATAATLRAGHVGVDLVPDAYVAEALLAAFPPPRPGADRVLVARAAVARDVLPDGLRAAGWQVDVVEAYRTVRPPVDPAVLSALAGADAVTFTSPSTVEGFLAVTRAAGLEAIPPVVACIGPVTAAAALAAGLTVTVSAATYTVGGLVDALVGALGPSGSDAPSPPAGR